MASQWRYGDLNDKNFQVSGHVLIIILLIFSFFVFFTILFLFVRWTCRYHRASTSPSTTTPTQLQVVEPSLGLHSTVIDNLPILLHRGSLVDEEDAQCSICLSAFIEQEKVKILPTCNHSYHPECVDKWLISHTSCPLCRSSISVDSPATI